MRSNGLFFYAVAAITCVRGAEPQLKPRHDSPEQLFRRAPMAESARSIVVNLTTNLHYAFDSDLCRVHTVWMGGPLNLWGPPYSYAKAPFICDFQGQVLESFPPVSPWWSGDEPLKTRFRGIDTQDGTVSFSYDLVIGAERVRIIEQETGNADANGWLEQRKFQFPQGCPHQVNLLLFAEGGASVERRENDSVQIAGTNGVCFVRANLGATVLPISIRREKADYWRLRITEEGTEKGFVSAHVDGEEFRARVDIARATEPFSVAVQISHGIGRPVKTAKEKTVARIFPASSEWHAPGGDDSYKIEYFPLPSEAELLITGMDWMPNGDLAICTWLGEIYFVQNAVGDVRKATYKRFASGLIEPLGLAVHNGEIFVVQKGELTKVVDTDQDGVADHFECINSSWGFSGNYHSYSFGPLITPNNDLFVFITGQRGLYDMPYQGWALKISPDGEHVQPFCSGLRVPHGWGFFSDEIFTTDNQGNWIGACRLNHLKPNHFYGFPSSMPARKGTPRAEDVEPPVLWFPRTLAPSASGFDTVESERFGPFRGQLLIGDFQNSIVMRAALERIGDRENGVWQGAVFPFAKGFLSGVNRLKMGPDGKLYVGGGKRTWSTAAPKEFSLDRVSFTGKIPFEVQSVRARHDGFDLAFTKKIDKKSSGDPANYVVKQFTYKYHPDYGSPEFDHNGKAGATETPVTKAELLDDGLTARLTIPGLRTGYVTAFQIAVSSAEDEDPRNDTFYYTLNVRPSQQQRSQ